MAQLGPYLALLGAAAVAVLLGLRQTAKAYNETGRRILRGLRTALKGEAEAFLIDYRRGRGVGFNFASMMMAVAWDAGAWCRLYRIDELLGVELMVDDQVAGWAVADRPPRPAEAAVCAERQVALRHLFDDPHHPDFLLELWSVDGEADETIPDGETAVREGSRWIEGMSALMAAVKRGAIEIDVPALPEAPDGTPSRGSAR